MDNPPPWTDPFCWSTMNEPWTEADDVIEEIRQIRMEISARFDHDTPQVRCVPHGAAEATRRPAGGSGDGAKVEVQWLTGDPDRGAAGVGEEDPWRTGSLSTRIDCD